MPDRQRMVEEFVELARIASLSKKEKAMAEAVAAKLRELGLEPELDSAGEAIGGEIGNLIAHLPATQAGLPRLMFNAHLDTVAPGEGIEPVVEGDRIASAGNTIVGADDKCGVVAALETVRCLMEENLAHGGVDVVFTIAEEIGLYGAIVPDLPPEEGGVYLKAMQKNQLAPIFIFSPTTPDERLKYLDSFGDGFVYCVARKGVTGADTNFSKDLNSYLARCRKATKLPLALGFGVKEQKDIDFLKGKVDIAVIGSETIRLIDDKGVGVVGEFIKSLKI